VLEVGDGIARIYGLSKAMAGEMLELSTARSGRCSTSTRTASGAVIYGDFETSRKATPSRHGQAAGGAGGR